MKIEKPELRDQTLSLRLKGSVLEQLNKLAKKSGVSRALFIEALILEEAKKQKKKR